MRILFLTSCTGEKRYKPENQLTEHNFKHRGTKAFEATEEALCAYRVPVGDMYTGQQHLRLLKGVEAMLQVCPEHTIDLKILSAGYGLLDELTPIVPYEMTLQGMNAGKIREWADFLDIPHQVLPLFSKYDLSFVLLGKEYLRAIHFPPSLDPQGVCVFLAGEGIRRFIPSGPNIVAATLGNADAKRLGAGLIALKGGVIERIECFTLPGECLVKETEVFIALDNQYLWAH